MGVEFEHHIDAIASGAWNFADDASFLVNERVDEGAFAYISSTDDRDLHRRGFDFLGRGVEFR